MKALFPLEDFGSRTTPPAAPDHPDPASGPDPEAMEALRMAAYEQGYTAGWEDAAAAQADDQARIGAEFARNLQDLGFTFHEARSHVMRALEPLLSEMTGKVLPRLISETIGQTIVEELMPLAEQASDAPIEIVVAPSGRAVVERLTEQSSIPLAIVEEPSLADGQVYLRLGQVERQVDLGGAVDRIGRAINAIYQINEKAMSNG